jgi:hypothetical protein
MSVFLEASTNIPCAVNEATKIEVEQVIKLAGAELQTLLEHRAALIRRLATLRRTISGLAEMFGDGVLTEDLQVLVHPVQKTRGAGLTEACRSILSNSLRPLTAREIVDGIQAIHPAVIQNHKDPVASVTSILHRLGSYGEATTTVSRSGRRTWAPIEDSRPDRSK